MLWFEKTSRNTKKVLDFSEIRWYYIKAVCERHARNDSKTADVPCKLNNEKHAIKKHLGQFLKNKEPRTVRKA